MEPVEERILKWPEIHPGLFKDTAFSGIRRALLFVAFFLLFLLVLTAPEWYLDERKNRDFYAEKLAAYDKTWQETRQSTAAERAEVRQRWFSPRMQDYKGLVYSVHVRKPFDDQKGFDNRLAEWQSRQREGKRSASVLHYLYNPGFFWDVGVLLPTSLAALCMAFYSLILHLAKFRNPTKEGRQPYVPRAAAQAFLKCILSPWALGICFIGGLLVTAGNHATGVADGRLISSLLLIGYAAFVPYVVLVAWRGGREIRERCGSAEGTPHKKAIDLLPRRWARWIFWAMAAVACTALALVLGSPDGLVERITGAELAQYKPVQRVVKGFLYALGILAALWAIVMVVECARKSPTLPPAGKGSKWKLGDRVSVLDDLVLNEVRLLEYFGVFAMFTILSYWQIAYFLWSRADAATAIGIAILFGLILLSLTLLVIPILYSWYFYVDLKRFDRWAEGVKGLGVLSEKESEELKRLQESRLWHVFGIVVPRWRSLGPALAMAGTVFYVGGITGCLGGIIGKVL